jgi:hypothetical protein
MPPRTTRAAARAQQDNESESPSPEIDTMESSVELDRVDEVPNGAGVETHEKPIDTEPPTKKKKGKKKAKKGKKDKADVTVDEVAGENSQVEGEGKHEALEAKVEAVVPEQVGMSSFILRCRAVQHDSATIAIVSEVWSL